MEEKRLQRVMIFLFFLFLTIILWILAGTPPATGYEISIYAVYPWYFWASIMLSLLVGCTAIMFSKHKGIVAYGFGIVVMINVILVGLQFFRGYFLYGGGDPFTHVGYVKDILASGHIPSTNFYPLQHLLMLNINQILPLSIKITSDSLSVIFYIFFGVSLYTALKKYSLVKYRYSLALGGLLIFGSQHVTPLPNILSFLFFPLILFLLTKLDTSQSKIRLNIILFIVVLTTIFFHPITSLYVLIVLILFTAASHFSFKFLARDYDLTHLNKTIISSIGAWCVWHLGFSSVRRGISTTIYSLLYESALNPKAEEYTRTLGMFDISIIDIFRKFIFEYGILSILFLLILIYLALMFFSKKSITKFVKHKEILFFISAVFLFAFWSGVNFFTDFVTFSRVFKLVIFFSFILLGFIYAYNMIFNKNYKTKNIHGVIFSYLVIALLIISVLGVYPSPISFSSNRQATEHENQGMRWFFEVQNDERLIWEEGIRQHRWADLIYGREGDDRPDNIRKEQNVMDHFGYQYHDNMAQNYSGYLIQTEFSRITYRNVFTDYKQYWRFNETSYDKLEKDDSVNRIYDNGYFTSFYVGEEDDI